MQKKELNLKETKEILLKAILDLRKEIKNADEIKFEMKKGTTGLPNEKGWNKLGYDGNMDISIHIYSKKNDERAKKS